MLKRSTGQRTSNYRNSEKEFSWSQYFKPNDEVLKDNRESKTKAVAERTCLRPAIHAQVDVGSHPLLEVQSSFSHERKFKLFHLVHFPNYFFCFPFNYYSYIWLALLSISAIVIQYHIFTAFIVRIGAKSYRGYNHFSSPNERLDSY